MTLDGPEAAKAPKAEEHDVAAAAKMQECVSHYAGTGKDGSYSFDSIYNAEQKQQSNGIQTKAKPIWLRLIWMPRALPSTWT